MPIVIGGVTYLTMADDIYAPNLRGLNVDALAGYDNGNWPDYQQIAAENPTKYLLDLSVFYSNTGTGGDFELGDMDPSEAVGYVNMRHAAGVRRPVIYASIASYMPQIIANLNAAGIPLSSVRLLSAHYGYGQHICGPTTCRLGAAANYTMDGTQWIDHNDVWDESLLDLNFFGTEPPPPTPPLPPSIPPEEDEVPRHIEETNKTLHILGVSANAGNTLGDLIDYVYAPGASKPVEGNVSNQVNFIGGTALTILKVVDCWIDPDDTISVLGVNFFGIPVRYVRVPAGAVKAGSPAFWVCENLWQDAGKPGDGSFNG